MFYIRWQSKDVDLVLVFKSPRFFHKTLKTLKLNLYFGIAFRPYNLWPNYSDFLPRPPRHRFVADSITRTMKNGGLLTKWTTEYGKNRIFITSWIYSLFLRLLNIGIRVYIFTQTVATFGLKLQRSAQVQAERDINL